MKTPESMGYPLEVSGAQMRDLVNCVLDHLVPVIESLPNTPIDTSSQFSSDDARALREPLPIIGSKFEAILSTLLTDAMPSSLSPISGGFMGYVPGGGIFYSALADLISSTINRYVGAAPVAPGMSEIEANVIRWFAQIVGFPATAKGFMTSGGSLANQSALNVARFVKCGESFQNAIIYLSDQSHNCLTKAARLGGFPAKNVRVIATDRHYRIRVDALTSAISADRNSGMKPLFVAGNAGTTNTGAIDPLDDLAALCREQDLWFHVDAAYGGFFNLTETGRLRLTGLSKADSIALDPHKTLFLPYGTGALLVRDGSTLLKTYAMDADYLPETTVDNNIMDFRDISPELTRPFRGLRVWLPLKLHGADVFASYLDEKLNLANHVYLAIEANSALEVLAPPELSILAFAVAAKRNETLAARNARSQQLLARINHKNRVHLTGTLLHGVYAIRVAVGVYRTHQSHIELLLADLQASLNELKEERND